MKNPLGFDVVECMCLIVQFREIEVFCSFSSRLVIKIGRIQVIIVLATFRVALRVIVEGTVVIITSIITLIVFLTIAWYSCCKYCFVCLDQIL